MEGKIELSDFVYDNLFEESKKVKTSEDWAVLGLFSFGHGEYREAIKCFDMGLELDPKNPDLYAQRADIYWACNEKDEALSDYEMALFCGGGLKIKKMRDELKEECEAEKKLQKMKKRNTKNCSNGKKS